MNVTQKFSEAHTIGSLRFPFYAIDDVKSSYFINTGIEYR